MSAEPSPISLEKFRRSREILRHVYESSLEHFDTMRKILREKNRMEDRPGDHNCGEQNPGEYNHGVEIPGDDGHEENREEKAHEAKNKFLTNEQRKMFLTVKEEAYLKKAVETQPTIIISGLVNSGKSRLINKLLGGKDILVKSASPCTSVKTTVKYSPYQYLQRYDDKGNTSGEQIKFETVEVPWKYIDLHKHPEGTAEALKKGSVEVGLNNDFLRHGVQIIDLPGLNENDKLDEVVNEQIHGRFQLLIYVFDFMKIEDKKDTNFLKQKRTTPLDHIIYVCNKIDNNDDKDDDNEAEELKRSEKGFGILQKNGLLAEERTFSPDMDDYHGLSCIKISRPENKKDRYRRNFQKFREAVMNGFSLCIDSDLKTAVYSLFRSQQRLFDYFTSEKMLETPENEFSTTLMETIAKNELVREKIKSYIKKEWECTIENLLAPCWENTKKGILQNVEDLEVEPNSLKKDTRGNYVINVCDTQVCEVVLTEVIERIAEKLEGIKSKLNKDLESEVRKYTERPFKRESSFFQTHCNSFLTKRKVKLDMLELKVEWARKLKNSWCVSNTNTNVTLTLIVSDNYLPEKWKKDAAQFILSKINPENITKYIVTAALERIDQYYNELLFKLNQEKGFIKYNKLLPSHRETVCDIIPKFVANMCLTEALSTTLREGAVELGDRINKGGGSRNEVYECRKYENLIGKKITGEFLPHPSFSQLYCYLNKLPKHEHQARVTKVVFDTNWDFTILQEKFDDTLYDLLTREHGLSLSLRARVKMCLQVAEVCQHAVKNNLTVDDLRINNILVKRTEDGIQAYVNFSKWKKTKAPYPDKLPAFHFGPDIMFGRDGNPDQRTESYSMAVLLLLLVIGKYERPDFSKDPKLMETIREKNFDSFAMEMKEQFMNILDANWEGSKDEQFYISCSDILDRYLNETKERMNIEHFVIDVKKLMDSIPEDRDSVR